MAGSGLPYDVGTVRRLLLAAFDAEELRRHLRDRPTFRPILTRLSAQHGLDDIVDQVIDYCDRHDLFDELLDGVREENPAQYARFEGRLHGEAGDEIALRILKPGSTLLNGRYRIVRHIARGGFGSVYLAQDTLLREEVAIKELIPALVGDEIALKRFLVEAKAMMQLAHPHIVHTRDIVVAGGNYYMVMEHMAGGSLEDRIRTGKPLAVDEAVRILADVCEGLAYAHERGVIHCDLKPANVLLDATGAARVADFGVAHVSDQVVTRTWITPGGFSGGTLPYMSPEQTDGVRDDPRVDVYALGAILYRALTGRMYLEFDQRDTPRAQSDNVQRISTHQPLPPSSYNHRIPAWLDAVILKALAKRPEDRFASVREMRSALLNPPSGPAMPAVPPGPRPLPAPAAVARRVPRWMWPAAGGLVVLIVALVFVLRLAGGEPRATPLHTAAAIAAATTPAGPTPNPAGPTSTPSATASLVATSPTQVPRTDMPTPEPTPVPPSVTLLPTRAPAAPTAPPATPVPPTQPPATQAPPTAAPALTGRIAFTSYLDRRPEIYVINFDGSGLARLTNNQVYDYSPRWSPDGKRIAFVSNRDGNDEIYVMNADGSGVTRLTYEPAIDRSPAWGPDGRIAFESTRDGSVNANIFVMNADGSGVQRLTDNPTNDQSPAWSPDGQRIAFTSDRDKNWEIYVMNADGSGQKNVTNKLAVDGSPAWSARGQIAFASTREGNTRGDVYVMNPDGSGVRRLTTDPESDVAPAWSPDGRTIVFVSQRTGSDELYRMNADGSDVRRLTSTSLQASGPSWAPR